MVGGRSTRRIIKRKDRRKYSHGKERNITEKRKGREEDQARKNGTRMR